jgi:hypothetical protein
LCLINQKKEEVMATWNDLISYVNANYKWEKVSDDLMSLQFDMGDGRSQLVFVQLLGNSQDWAAVASPVGGLDKVKKLDAYCRAASDWVCGGIVIIGNYIMIRDSFPLANLDVNEFEQPLHAIVNAADDIERMITGGDSY